MAIEWHKLALPKPEKRRRVKARKARAEKRVKDAVRAACVERDGHCRTGSLMNDAGDLSLWLYCDGPSEWAHMPERRRSKTRGMDPTFRHDTKHTLMLCRTHHAQFDGRAEPRLFITALTRKGCDGPVRFRRRKER